MDDLITQRVRELAAGVDAVRREAPTPKVGLLRSLFASASDPVGAAREIALPALNALIDLRVKAETDSPASLPLFRGAVPDALALLSNQDDGVRGQAVTLLGIMKMDAVIVVPRLIEELQRANAEQWRETWLIPRAIASYGADAAPAVPVLLEVMQSADDHNTLSQCAHALSAIGPAALGTVPAIEAARDRLTMETGQRDRSFKSTMNKAIKTLLRSARPPKPAPNAGDGEGYLLDLFERMATPDTGLAYPAPSTAQKAFKEAESLSDAALVGHLASLLSRQPALKASHLAEAATVLGFLTRNTGSPDGRRLILELLQRPRLPALALQTTIYAAARNELREAIPAIKPLIRAGDSNALDFATDLRLDECVPDVIEYTKGGKGSPLLGIFALQAIGSPAAIPTLMEYAAREPAMAAAEQEWQFYAIVALGTIGDPSVVPFLIDLLPRLDGWNAAPAIDALQRLADPRAHAAIVAALTRIVDEGIARPERLGWSEGYRTPIVNALDLFRKIGTQHQPEVIALVNRLQEPTLWARLLPEEQAFLREQPRAT